MQHVKEMKRCASFLFLTASSCYKLWLNYLVFKYTHTDNEYSFLFPIICLFFSISMGPSGESVAEK